MSQIRLKKLDDDYYFSIQENRLNKPEISFYIHYYQFKLQYGNNCFINLIYEF